MISYRCLYTISVSIDIYYIIANISESISDSVSDTISDLQYSQASAVSNTVKRLRSSIYDIVKCLWSPIERYPCSYTISVSIDTYYITDNIFESISDSVSDTISDLRYSQASPVSDTPDDDDNARRRRTTTTTATGVVPVLIQETVNRPVPAAAVIINADRPHSVSLQRR